MASINDLVKRDKLCVQSHEVTGLWHLAHHERYEGSVTLPLFACQRGLRQQNAGLDGILNYMSKNRSICIEMICDKALTKVQNSLR